MIYFEKIRLFKAGIKNLLKCTLNSTAWDNKIRPLYYFFYWFSNVKVMINRDNWGHWYSIVRSEILRFMEDQHRRKHLSRMFSLIKNESLGIKDD